jgi:hypothetical protein
MSGPITEKLFVTLLVQDSCGEPNFSNLCQTLTDWQLENSSRTVPKSDLFIPKNLRSLVPNSYIHVSVIDFYIFQNRSQIHECGNWETEHYNSVLKITRSRGFISGNT